MEVEDIISVIKEYKFHLDTPSFDVSDFSNRFVDSIREKIYFRLEDLHLFIFPKIYSIVCFELPSVGQKIGKDGRYRNFFIVLDRYPPQHLRNILDNFLIKEIRNEKIKDILN